MVLIVAMSKASSSYLSARTETGKESEIGFLISAHYTTSKRLCGISLIRISLGLNLPCFII